MTARIGVLTSGGDAPGMNPVVRAIVRAGIHAGAEVFAITEGWQGAVDGGDRIRRLGWSDVSGILNLGGTVIGTARSADFRTREGMRQACRNLIWNGIDRVIVVGGDGSLTGTSLLRQRWPEFIEELLASGEISAEQAERHRYLIMAGLVGSIDNDMVGTDMTIGTDSALHRITEAIDAISSTAASHQRTFVIEVMGRHCGYLALMSAIAGGADYAMLPEFPPKDGWEDRMCEILRTGREAGRRDSIVLVAEGAADRHGVKITAAAVAGMLKERLGEDARVTILGHVQRGGKPSAYDRWMPTMLGVAAVEEVLTAHAEREPQLVGVRGNSLHMEPLIPAVENTRAVAGHVEAGRYDEAMAARGSGFTEMFGIYRALGEPAPRVEVSDPARRIGMMHAGALAPGMNQIVRSVVRLGLHEGCQVIGIRGGFPGLRDGQFSELAWADVEGWAGSGGANLGTQRYIPDTEDLYALARSLEEARLDGLIIAGGFHAYAGLRLMNEERRRYPAFDLPVVALPATIDNNLPGWKMSVGSDTALNVVVDSIDMLRQSAAASKRAFVVETMGRLCGFLTLMGGLAGGAERVYLPELGITLAELQADSAALVESFASGRNFYLAVRGEHASELYTTDVLARLFEAEGKGNYSVRQSVLGHVQQGGNPTPFDRINAARLAARGVSYLSEQIASGRRDYAVPGEDGMIPFRDIEVQMDWERQRPVDQWWLKLLPVLRQLSRRPGD
ncbi:MAG: 6-phosphofructokinase [Propionibacteriaceae bacterium]|nr:6-phosphofructokinase [Propionibacteriaceae bacterium]